MATGKTNEEKTEKLTKLIQANKEKKLGLEVVEKNSKVVVSAVESGSLANDHMLKIDDIIVAINDEQVKDTTHCKSLLAKLISDGKDFEVVIERSSVAPPKFSTTPIFAPNPANTATAPQQQQPKVEKAEEAVEVPEFDFQQPKVAAQKKKPKTERIVAAFAPISFMEDEELGNPLDGITFPAPSDVRAILRKRIPEILADYQNVESACSVKTKSSAHKEQLKFEEKASERDIGSDVPMSKSLRVIKTKKK